MNLNQLHKELFTDTELVIKEARNIAQTLRENPNTRSQYPQLRTIDPKVLTHSGQPAEKVQFEQDVDILVDHLNKEKQLRYNTLSTTTAATNDQDAGDASHKGIPIPTSSADSSPGNTNTTAS